MQETIQSFVPVWVALVTGGLALVTIWFQAKVQRQNAREHATGQERNRESFDHLKSMIGTVSTDVTGIKSDVAGIKSDVAGIKSDVRSAESEIDVLQNRLSSTHGAHQ